MTKGLRSKAKDLSSAVSKGYCQLSKARVIASEMMHLLDKREKRAVRRQLG